VVDVELLGDGQSDSRVLISAVCDGDIDGNNGQLQHTIRLVPRANVQVNGAAADVRTEVGASFAFPRVFVQSTSETPDVTLTMRIPGSLSIASAIPDTGVCEVSSGTVSCEFGDLIDETRWVDLNLGATQTGTFTTEIEVAAADDATPDDNSLSIDVIVDPARPTSSGGAGGGGALDWWSLALATLGLGLRRRQRVSAAGGYTEGDAPMDLDRNTDARCARDAVECVRRRVRGRPQQVSRGLRRGTGGRQRLRGLGR
jgi:hypothetical protein